MSLQSGTFARETSSEPASPDTSLRPVLTKMEDERQTMTEGQYKCLELFSRDQQHNRTGKVQINNFKVQRWMYQYQITLLI